MDGIKTIGTGFFFEDLKIGFRFRTHGRTITEADLANFVNLTWLTEELFTNTADTAGRAIQGRFVPAALVYAFAEGLLTPAIQDTGLAFLHAEVDVKGPTFVGDTIHVECEVTEARQASKGGRGLARTVNRVVNQKGATVLTYNPLRMVKMRV
jgi:acyl dehydratase